jgi:hypothetical protein
LARACNAQEFRECRIWTNLRDGFNQQGEIAMPNRLIRTLLGASFVAASLGVAAGAKAHVLWHNANNESQVLGVSGGNMNNGTQLITYHVTGWSDQHWVEIPYRGSSYRQLYSEGALAPSSPPTSPSSSRCLALPNGNVAPNNQLIIWDCGYLTTDQSWLPVHDWNDGNGAACYHFLNEKALETGYGQEAFYSGAYGDGNSVWIGPWSASHPFLGMIWCSYNEFGQALDENGNVVP